MEKIYGIFLFSLVWWAIKKRMQREQHSHTPSLPFGWYIKLSPHSVVFSLRSIQTTIVHYEQTFICHCAALCSFSNWWVIFNNTILCLFMLQDMHFCCPFLHLSMGENIFCLINEVFLMLYSLNDCVICRWMHYRRKGGWCTLSSIHGFTSVEWKTWVRWLSDLQSVDHECSTLLSEWVCNITAFRCKDEIISVTNHCDSFWGFVLILKLQKCKVAIRNCIMINVLCVAGGHLVLKLCWALTPCLMLRTLNKPMTLQSTAILISV